MRVQRLISGDEAVLAAALSATGHDLLSDEGLRAHLEDPMLTCIVSLVEDQVVGFLYGFILRRFSKTTFFIYSVDVVETYRRKGIGRAMLDALSEEARSKGWDEMFVLTNSSNEPAKALYLAAGGVRPNSDDVMFDFYPLVGA